MRSAHDTLFYASELRGTVRGNLIIFCVNRLKIMRGVYPPDLVEDSFDNIIYVVSENTVVYVSTMASSIFGYRS